MHNRSVKAVVISIALIAHMSVAWAETADAAFKRGQAALKAGRVAEACQAFEESNKLEAKVETELRLADCYEQTGKLLTASRLYRTLSEKDSNAARRKTSAAKATQLEAKAPKLRITLNQQPDGLVVKVDGVEVDSTKPVPVDIGPHEVVAIAPGFEGRATVAIDKDRATVDVIVRLEPKAEPTPTPTPTLAIETPIPTPTPTPTASTRSGWRARHRGRRFLRRTLHHGARAGGAAHRTAPAAVAAGSPMGIRRAGAPSR